MRGQWTDDGMLEYLHLGGSWELWRCRLCGATRDRHINEAIDEYRVHGDPDAAERCMDRWARMQLRRQNRRKGSRREPGRSQPARSQDTQV